MERLGGGSNRGKGFFGGIEIVIDSMGFASCKADGPDPKGVFSFLNSLELSSLFSLDLLS